MLLCVKVGQEVGGGGGGGCWWVQLRRLRQLQGMSANSVVQGGGGGGLRRIKTIQFHTCMLSMKQPYSLKFIGEQFGVKFFPLI